MTPEQNTTRSPDEPMNTSNEERERLKRLVAETEWVRAGAVVDGHTIELADYARLADAFKHVIAENEAQAARVKALEAERDALITAVADHVTVRGEYFARIKALEAGLTGLNAAIDAYWNADRRNREPEIKALSEAQMRSVPLLHQGEEPRR